MRYYNVYLYSACPVEQNPKNIPSYWIWKCELCNENSEIPENAARMTLEQIRQYKQTNKANYNLWTGAKVAQQTHASKKVKKAIKNAQALIQTFSSENIIMGITQAGKTKLIADMFKDVFYYSQTGSLYECLLSLNQLTPTEETAPFFTQQRKTELLNKLTNILTNL